MMEQVNGHVLNGKSATDVKDILHEARPLLYKFARDKRTMVMRDAVVKLQAKRRQRAQADLATQCKQKARKTHTITGRGPE